ncbi:ATP-dependent helicase [Putridiphycobacter roseus]|uniref:ATP-dependent helicase n=1 Tax=Putridiphycobacter roseus TaxID=2219161 RepID=A0A2W1NCE2_9FLAO|nr:DEAD/DEAH box helicase [Putridiphycobacter roseus]PZE16753.1 ATP-dependent helicase [Putridiphycobacter roseus]
MKFTELNLKPALIEALDYMGFETATPIQEKAIPMVLDNKDLIACAQTGTGKTAAFVLPILNKLIGKKDTSIDTLVIVPTRELAIQIEQQIQGLSYFISVGSKAIYGGGGGKDWSEEKEALTVGTDIIVATPGKLISHLKLGYVNFKNVKHLVLDEADRMLDMGFIDDLQKIISFLPKTHQTLLFSATMPKSINLLAQKILNNPEEIRLSISKPAAGVTQSVYLTFDNQKNKVLQYILEERKDFESIIIFTSSKLKVSEIVKDLRRGGIPATGISSNLEQDKREEVLRGFRSRRIRILVATDVMSRGIDIKEINMVINYDVPHDAEDYVHRVGRTARANTTGEAITLINQKDMHRFRKIEALIEMEIPKMQPPAEIGEGPKWEAKGSGNSRPKHKHSNNKKRNFKKKPNQKPSDKQ